MFRLFCLIIGYGFGCLQSAFIVGKMFGNIDIREHGSGNAGMTNVARVMGAKPGAAVFAIDVLKAVAAYLLCSLIFGGGGTFTGAASCLPGLYAGLGVVLGHDFPFYLKFRGGKGAASSLGIIFCTSLWATLICFSAGLLAVVISRYISLAAMIIFILFPVALILIGMEPEAVLIGAVIAILGVIRHKSNISRLLHGNENKFTIKRKVKK